MLYPTSCNRAAASNNRRAATGRPSATRVRSNRHSARAATCSVCTSSLAWAAHNPSTVNRAVLRKGEVMSAGGRRGGGPLRDKGLISVLLGLFGGFAGLLEEDLLGTGCLDAGGVQPLMATVGQELARFGIVLEGCPQDANQPGLGRRVDNGHEQLDAAVEVARHPVGAGNKNERFAAMMKIQDAAVFEETVHNADDPDVLTQFRDTGPQTADAANIKLNLHALLRSAVQRLNDVRIHERVELGHDVALLALLAALRFTLNQGQQPRAQSQRRRFEAPVLDRLGIGRDRIEELRRVRAEVLVARHQAHVAVQARGDFVVVSGTEMDVAADTRRLAADHDADLGMHLQST